MKQHPRIVLYSFFLLGVIGIFAIAVNLRLKEPETTEPQFIVKKVEAKTDDIEVKIWPCEGEGKCE